VDIIAHRGGSGLYIENSLAAFANAVEKGCAKAELDVHLTKDHQVVVHHNAKLHRGYCRKLGGKWIARMKSML